MEDKPIKLERAYKRMISLLITRIRAEGRFWVRWLRTGRYTVPMRVIPPKSRDKLVYSVGGDDGATPQFDIADPIIQEAARLQLTEQSDDS